MGSPGVKPSQPKMYRAVYLLPRYRFTLEGEKNKCCHKVEVRDTTETQTTLFILWVIHLLELLFQNASKVTQT